MNSPSDPSEKRDHGDHRSSERQKTREQILYMPAMPVNAASIPAAKSPRSIGPSLIESSAAVLSKVVCSSK